MRNSTRTSGSRRMRTAVGSRKVTVLVHLSGSGWTKKDRRKLEKLGSVFFDSGHARHLIIDRLVGLADVKRALGSNGFSHHILRGNHPEIPELIRAVLS